MAVRLFVGNLSFDVSEAELRDVFSAAGTVTHIFFPLDRETGKPRGFAFVEYGEKAEADEAIRRFNGHELQGRGLVVNEARSREAGPGGGRPAPPPSRSYQPRTPWLEPIEDTEIKPSRLKPRDVGPEATDKHKRKKNNKNNKKPRSPRGESRERGGGRFYGEFDYEED
jgi:RNA recognition motif-containing protein